MYQTEADADVLIVPTALNFAYDGFPTVIIGNDTDFLVMLIGHARSTDIVYMPHRGRGKLQKHCTTYTKCNNSLDMLPVITCSLCMKYMVVTPPLLHLVKEKNKH